MKNMKKHHRVLLLLTPPRASYALARAKSRFSRLLNARLDKIEKLKARDKNDESNYYYSFTWSKNSRS